MPFARLLAICLMLAAPAAVAYEQIYAPTPDGQTEIKTLPARQAMRARAEEPNANYFSDGNGLFRRLFAFISANDVAMTVPVEARISPAEMTFFAGAADQRKPLASNASVTVQRLPARQVAAIGYRGPYTQERFEQNKQKLQAWLAAHPQYAAAAPAYAVYWDSPFTLWFLKRAEVHIPVQKRQ